MREVSLAARSTRKLPAKVYGVMALTTVMTFATLTTGYELFFTRQVVAEAVATNYRS